jgi:hypothetical protein
MRDTGQKLQLPRVEIRFNADCAQHGLIDAGRPVHVKSEIVQHFYDSFNVMFCRMLLEYDDHIFYPLAMIN